MLNKVVDLNEFVFDIEVFKNDIFIGIKNLEGNFKLLINEDNFYDQVPIINNNFIESTIWIGYNVKYDKLILETILQKYDKLSWTELCNLCYDITQDFIQLGKQDWEIKKSRGIYRTKELNTFDIWFASGKQGSLKEFSIRLKKPLVIVNSIKWDKEHLSPSEKLEIENYLMNGDIETTYDLLKQNDIYNRYEAQKMLVQYLFGNEIDYLKNMSKSIQQLITKKFSSDKYTPLVKPFKYTTPKQLESLFNSFRMPQLKDLYETIKNITIDPLTNLLEDEDDDEDDITSVKTKTSKGFSIPLELENPDGTTIKISFGLGGIHSINKSELHYNLLDWDFGSYYPNLMILFDFLPKQMLNKELFKSLISMRLKLKDSSDTNDKKLSDALKLVINNFFGVTKYMSKSTGKLGSLFDAEATLNTTITGELLMLKMTEDLILDAKVSMKNLNTDGGSGKVLENNSAYLDVLAKYRKYISIEETVIDKVAYRDVNNYIAIVKNDINSNKIKLKLKGVYDTNNILKKSAGNNRIVATSIVDNFVNGSKLENIIDNNNNVMDYVLYDKYNSTFESIYLYPSHIASEIETEYLNCEGDVEKLKEFYTKIETNHYNGIKLLSPYRYVLGSKAVQNKVIAFNITRDKTNNQITKIGAITRANNTDIIICNDISTIKDIKQINKRRYFNLICDTYQDLFGITYESNEYVKNIIAKANIDKNASYFEAGHATSSGVIKLIDKGLLHPETTTINLKTGCESGYLCLDVDNPQSEKAKKLTDWITENDFIVYSSQYTFEDVKNYKCNYKWIFKYDSTFDLTKSKKNIDIELFYKKGCTISIYGKRADNYEYVSNIPFSEIKPLHLDWNDFLQFKVAKNKPKNKDKINGKIFNIQDEYDLLASESETVDLKYVKQLVRNYGKIDSRFDREILMVLSNKVIKFNCPFNDLHTENKVQPAGILKSKGKYWFNCFGTSCVSEDRNKFNKYLQDNAVIEFNSENVPTKFKDMKDIIEW